MKHAPGPWQISETRKRGELEYDIEIKKPITLVATTWTEANACLIAAAPELLEACKAALFELSGINNGKECKQLGQAIAKAEGKCE